MEETTEVAENQAETAALEEMATSGLAFGRRKSKTNPKMKRFIFTTRSGFEIFDLTQTVSALQAASKALSDLAAKRSLVLVVGTEPAAKSGALALASEFGFPYVVDRWLGGTLTNYATLSKRIQYFKKLKDDKAAGRLDKYTKKERVLFDRKIEKMTKLFGGLERLERLPDALIVSDAAKNLIAVNEAKRLNIPVVAIGNTDANPDLITHLVPASTGSKASVAWVLAKFSEALRDGLKAASAAPASPETASGKS